MFARPKPELAIVIIMAVSSAILAVFKLEVRFIALGYIIRGEVKVVNKC